MSNGKLVKISTPPKAEVEEHNRQQVHAQSEIPLPQTLVRIPIQQD